MPMKVSSAVNEINHPVYSDIRFLIISRKLFWLSRTHSHAFLKNTQKNVPIENETKRTGHYFGKTPRTSESTHPVPRGEANNIVSFQGESLQTRHKKKKLTSVKVSR